MPHKQKGFCILFGDGSLDSPYATIRHALSKAGAGQSVEINLLGSIMLADSNTMESDTTILIANQSVTIRTAPESLGMHTISRYIDSSNSGDSFKGEFFNIAGSGG